MIRFHRCTVTAALLAAAVLFSSGGCSKDAPEPEPARHLRIAILGDSISSYEGWNPAGYSTYYPKGDVDDVSKTWWHQLIFTMMEDAELDVNSSFAGTKVTTETATKRIGKDLVSRAADLGTPDVIFIHGGTNDHNQQVGLGNYDYDLKVEELDQSLFRPAYIKLIKVLQERFPEAQPVCIVGDFLADEYAESIIKIARHCNVPCISFNGMGDRIPKVTGSHPTAAGHALMARKIMAEAGAYLR